MAHNGKSTIQQTSRQRRRAANKALADLGFDQTDDVAKTLITSLASPEYERIRHLPAEERATALLGLIPDDAPLLDFAYEAGVPAKERDRYAVLMARIRRAVALATGRVDWDPLEDLAVIAADDSMVTMPLFDSKGSAVKDQRGNAVSYEIPKYPLKEVRLPALKEVCSYLYAKRKAIDVTGIGGGGNINFGIQLIASNPDGVSAPVDISRGIELFATGVDPIDSEIDEGDDEFAAAS